MSFHAGLDSQRINLQVLIVPWNTRAMDVSSILLVLLSLVLYCNGASIEEQLAHLAQRKLESEGIMGIDIQRRFNMEEGSVILGAPSYAGHLPEAEPILPGHTLLRPTVNMLKSAVKFPHLDLENGSGVYGNVGSLGLRYDGKNERVLYSGFRRTPTEFVMVPKSDTSAESNDGITLLFRKKLLQKHPSYFNLLTFKDDKSQNEDKMNIPKKSDKGLHGRSNLYDRTGPDQESNNSLENRLHTSINTLLFTKQLIKKLQVNRRQRKQDNLIIISPHELDTDLNDTQIQKLKDSLGELSENEQSKKWFWKSKDSFNHVKFNSDAPEHEEYLPAVPAEDNLRNWWFYHQADFKPFNLDDN